jgi:type IV pilus assembly protein PilE
MKTRLTKAINPTLKAFSLMEVLIVLAIIGILTLSAATYFGGTVSKAYSLEAQQNLNFIFTLEKTYFYTHSKYSDNLKEIGFENAKTSKEGGNAKYTYEVTQASNAAFKVRATAVEDFNANGVFNVWEVDQDKNIKEVTPD